jgi:hypothetical protein
LVVVRISHLQPGYRFSYHLPPAFGFFS